MQLCVHLRNTLHAQCHPMGLTRASLLEGLLHRPFLRVFWESVILIHVY